MSHNHRYSFVQLRRSRNIQGPGFSPGEGYNWEAELDDLGRIRLLGKYRGPPETALSKGISGPDPIVNTSPRLKGLITVGSEEVILTDSIYILARYLYEK